MLKTKVIDAAFKRKGASFAELWAHRELISLFIRRQIVSRYRQMLLGGFWAVLEPLATLAMMSIVFGFLLRVDTAGYPYPIYAFAALIPWFLFSKTTLAVASSLQENMALISKVYFPRLVLPIASAFREIFDNLITLAILIALAIGFGFFPSWKYLLLLPMICAISIFAIGLGLWFSAIMVRFRDIRPLLSIVLQAGMYATPIFYPETLVPEWLLPLYQLNPMYWGVAIFRWIMLNQEIMVTPMLYVSLTASLLVVASGLWIFSAYEKMTVDVQ